MKVKCTDCEGDIEIPNDVTMGEIVTCPDCGLDFEVSKVDANGVSLEKAESMGEDWGE
ncbi:MAG: alpha-aminoadipate/glutamate carrier protein LysW/ArgW [Nitrososphaerales archaeon]